MKHRGCAWFPWFWALAVAAVLAGLAGCAGGKGLPEAQGGAAELTSTADLLAGDSQVVNEDGKAPALDLPAPSELPRVVSGPPAPGDRLRTGYDWDFTLPHQYISLNQFSPTSYSGDSVPISSAAYACFSFPNMASYGGQQLVRLQWYLPPTGGKAYMGLSNYKKDRWDWFNVSSATQVAVSSLADYTAADEQIHVYFVIYDTFSASLDWVLLGDSQYTGVYISTDLDADPTQNIAPRVVQFDASNSESAGGTNVSWNWDWETDGVWDAEGDTDGLESHLFTPGEWTVTVQVTDDEGAIGVGTKTFLIIDPDNQPPNAVINASDTSGNAPLTVNFDALASFDPDGTIIKFEWDCNNDGVYEFNNGTDFQQVYTFARKGLTLVHLRVTDNNLATDTAAVGIFLNNGWRITTVDPDVYINDQISMAAIGSDTKLPCVVYQSWEDTSLRFAKAKTADGAEWNNPVEPVSSVTLRTGYSPSVAALVDDGRPLIAYGTFELDTGQTSLYVVSASDGGASSWNLPQLVSGAEQAGTLNSLAIINTTPAIASLAGNGGAGYQMKYFMAQNAQGTSWNPGRVISASGGSYYDASLGASGSGLFKYPTLAYSRFVSGAPPYLEVMVAEDLDGLAWNEAYHSEDLYISEVSYALIDGKPAVFCGRDAQDGEGYFLRASDSNGAAWAEPQHICGGAGGSLAVLNGKPACCFWDLDRPGLWFVTAKDAAGSDWNTPYLIDTAPGVALYSYLLVLNDMPVVCYSDYENNYLKAAYWEN